MWLHEVVHTFGWYLRKFIGDARTKGATALVLSPTVRNIWHEGRVERGPGDYEKWSGEAARSEGVAFVDVTAIIADRYEKMGAETVKRFFPRDHTHTDAEGAELNAACTIAGLRALPGGRWDRYFSAKGAETAPAAADQARAPDFLAWLHLPEPADPRLPTLFLIGDSTVRNGRGDGANGQWGWGDYLAPYFDTARLNVVNRAVGGLSSRTYLTLGTGSASSR